jgi:hypothetical protein
MHQVESYLAYPHIWLQRTLHFSPKLRALLPKHIIDKVNTNSLTPEESFALLEEIDGIFGSSVENITLRVQGVTDITTYISSWRDCYDGRNSSAKEVRIFKNNLNTETYARFKHLLEVHNYNSLDELFDELLQSITSEMSGSRGEVAPSTPLSALSAQGLRGARDNRSSPRGRSPSRRHSPQRFANRRPSCLWCDNDEHRTEGCAALKSATQGDLNPKCPLRYHSGHLAKDCYHLGRTGVFGEARRASALKALEEIRNKPFISGEDHGRQRRRDSKQ